MKELFTSIGDNRGETGLRVRKIKSSMVNMLSFRCFLDILIESTGQFVSGFITVHLVRDAGTMKESLVSEYSIVLHTVSIFFSMRKINKTQQSHQLKVRERYVGNLRRKEKV